MEDRHIQKIREGNMESFSYLIDKYKQTAFSIAVKIVKNEWDAEEIVQDSFVKVYNNIHKFRGESKFSTWLFKIVYNTAISKVRLKAVKHSEIEENNLFEHQHYADYNLAFKELNLADKKAIIKSVLKELDEIDFALITLYFFEEKEIAEISQIVKLSKSNVKTSLFRARKKLYRKLQKALHLELNDIRYE